MTDPDVLPKVASRLPPGWKEAARPQVECMYSVVSGRAGQRTRRFSLLYRATQQVARSEDLGEVLSVLEEDLKLHVAVSAPSRVFLHAGVVGWKGRAIVLPGRSCAGKSTLVDALLKAGATYYSDEYAVLDDRGRVHPYARPLRLRPRAGESAAPPARDPSELRVGRRPLPVSLVAMTHYEPGARWSPKALSPGQAVLALMETAVPVRNRPEATMHALREVVTHAPVVRGPRGEVEEAVEQLLGA